MKRNALCWKQTHSGAAVSLAGLECFFADCRFRIPSRHMTRRTKRRTPRGSASHLRDRRFQRRELVRTMRPDGRMTAVITATISLPRQCSVVR